MIVMRSQPTSWAWGVAAEVDEWVSSDTKAGTDDDAEVETEVEVVATVDEMWRGEWLKKMRLCREGEKERKRLRDDERERFVCQRSGSGG